MKKGDTFTIEWDVDGMLWEVDVEFTGEFKSKNNIKRGRFVRLDNENKYYNFTKKALNAMLATEWQELAEGEEF